MFVDLYAMQLHFN